MRGQRFVVSSAMLVGILVAGCSGKTEEKAALVAAQGDTTASGSAAIEVGAPRDLAYAPSSILFLAGKAIADMAPSYAGGKPTSYSVTPALPTGLTVDEKSGVITGKPEAASKMVDYTIVGTNAAGSSSAIMYIGVRLGTPSNLKYTSPWNCGLNQPATNTPTLGSGAQVTFSIVPALPAGLSLDAKSGVISGTPTTTQVASQYTVSAKNAEGTATASPIIAVSANVEAPFLLQYVENPAKFTKGIEAKSVPSNLGGAPSAYGISPSLPPGLTMNSGSGVISGIPTTLMEPVNYKAIASNAAGNTAVYVSVSVVDKAPTGLNYATNPAEYQVNKNIDDNVPSAMGGAITEYSVTPSLPMGILLNSKTGVINGKADATSGATDYLIKGTNSSGVFTDTTLRITVTE